MRRYIAAAILACAVGAVAAAMPQQDPAHPWPDHEPPASYFCQPAKDEHAVQTDLHACSCLGMIKHPDCGDTPDEDQAQQNSGRCKSWCKLDHCACGGQCKSS